MQNLLVTGSTGFIGRNLLESLNKKNYNVYGTSKKKITRFNKKVKYIKINLLKHSQFLSLPIKIDYIIHLAGNPKTFLTKKNEIQKQYLNNKNIMKNLLIYAKNSGCKKFIFISSVYVYSGNKSSSFHEGLNLKPKDSLGVSKYENEMQIKKFSRSKDVNTKFIIFRAFTVYGPHQNERQFLSQLKKNFLQKKIINLYNYKIQRDFVYINDVIYIILKTLKLNFKNKFSIYNLASGKSYSIGHAAEILKKKLKINTIINFINQKINKFDFNHSASINKISKKFNWSPKTFLEKGISSII